MSSELDQAQFKALLDMLRGWGQVLQAVPIDQARQCVSHADAFGPLLDPSEWQRAADNLPLMADLLAAAAALRDAAAAMDAYTRKGK